MRNLTQRSDSVGVLAGALLVLMIAAALFVAVQYYLSVGGPQISLVDMGRGLIERIAPRPPTPDPHRQVHPADQ